MSESYANEIVEEAGATKPFRDSIDAIFINDFKNSTGTVKSDIKWSNYPTGWPTYSTPSPPVDNDSDGMSDSWEIANGLNVSLNDSALDKNNNGYSNIEEYLFYLGGYSLNNSTPRIIKVKID